MVLLCFFFFKQKTAYEMRISDWSSDVCSSDLADGEARLRGRRRVEGGGRSGRENRRFGRYREGRSGRGKGRREEGHREEGGQERLRRVRQAARHDYMSGGGRHDAYPPPSVFGTFTWHRAPIRWHPVRSEEHTSELQSLMRLSSAVFSLKKNKHTTNT